ncbi:MAG TPA: hypothetical protein VE778_01165 [Candidatus Bathyarchaeia archaeon]|nr:hypothetical protein [Candidatus Bathyarchaeia archaeon]
MQTHVDTYRLVIGRQRFWFNDTTETGVPEAVFSLDRQCLYLALQFSVHFDFDVADFREGQTIVQLEPRLWVSERIVSMLRTKTRATGSLTAFYTKEERLERLIQTTQHVLKYLAVNGTNIVANFFDGSELLRLYHVADAFVVG